MDQFLPLSFHYCQNFEYFNNPTLEENTVHLFSRTFNPEVFVLVDKSSVVKVRERGTLVVVPEVVVFEEPEVTEEDTVQSDH